MRWLVVLLLSLLGFVMGFITLLHVGLRMEQLIWLFVFLLNAFLIFQFTEERHFGHGFITGLLSCVWVVVIHLLYYGKYIYNHPDIALLNTRLERGFNPKFALLIIELTKSFFYALMNGIFAMMVGAGLRKYYEDRR